MDKKLLYLHLASVQPPNSGGLNTTLLQVFSMCNAFASAGYDVTLGMQNSNDFKTNIQMFIDNSFKNGIRFEIKTWDQKSNKLFLNKILVKRSIMQIVNENKPHLIFTREVYILGDLIKFNIPLIFESHNALLHNRQKLLHKYLERKLSNAANSPNFKCLFSISEALSQHWQKKGFPQHKLFAWHDGFDVSIFEGSVDKNIAKIKLNLSSHETIATYTGGLYPDRDIEDILDLAKIFPAVYFLVIGGPEKRREYFNELSLKSSITNINFIGVVEHRLIPYYLFASDILLALWSKRVPTINYCSPMKIFEYMAAGRTIIAHDFPTIREVLEDGKDAILCKPGNFDSLKLALGKALNTNNHSTMGKIARDKAFNFYSWDNRVSKLIKFLNNS